MDKLKDDILAEIGKKRKAYPHEVTSMVAELQLLRDIYNGRKPKGAYEAEVFTAELPMTLIVEDKPNILVGDVGIVADVGKTYLGRHSISASANWQNRRYLIHRIK